MDPLAGKVASHMLLPFRPKTNETYSVMFKVFLAFCIHMEVSLHHLSVKVMFAFMKCLVCNKASPAVLPNYVSAIKARCLLYDVT